MRNLIYKATVTFGLVSIALLLCGARFLKPRSGTCWVDNTSGDGSHAFGPRLAGACFGTGPAAYFVCNGGFAYDPVTDTYSSNNCWNWSASHTPPVKDNASVAGIPSSEPLGGKYLIATLE